MKSIEDINSLIDRLNMTTFVAIETKDRKALDYLEGAVDALNWVYGKSDDLIKTTDRINE